MIQTNAMLFHVDVSALYFEESVFISTILFLLFYSFFLYISLLEHIIL